MCMTTAFVGSAQLSLLQLISISRKSNDPSSLSWFLRGPCLTGAHGSFCTFPDSFPLGFGGWIEEWPKEFSAPALIALRLNIPRTRKVWTISFNGLMVIIVSLVLVLVYEYKHCNTILLNSMSFYSCEFIMHSCTRTWSVGKSRAGLLFVGIENQLLCFDLCVNGPVYTHCLQSRFSAHCFFEKTEPAGPACSNCISSFFRATFPLKS